MTPGPTHPILFLINRSQARIFPPNPDFAMKAFPVAPVVSYLFALCWGLSACGPEPEPMDVVEATIAQVQEAILSGRTTCRMVVQAYLDRIEAYDEATVNAITVLNPNALTRADEIDAAVQSGRGTGVPLLRAHAGEGQLRHPRHGHLGWVHRAGRELPS